MSNVDENEAIQLDLKDNSPKLCKMISPHLIYSEEEICNDLKGCILHIYQNYKYMAPDYTVQMAISDAYIGIKKAIEYDDTTIADAEGFAVNKETGEYPLKKGEKMKKVVFSTLAFTYIRGHIQQGMKAYKNHVSLDKLTENGDSLISSMTTESKLILGRRRKSLESSEISELRREIIHRGIKEALTVNEQKIIKEVFGFNGKEKLSDIKEDDKDTDFMAIMDNRYTQTTAAAAIGVSKQRVCNVQNKAMEKLQEWFDDHLDLCQDLF